MRITDGRVRVAASDVANFLACRRLTQLDLLRARGELRPPHARDLGFEDLVRRGEEHERAVLERFRADGREVADLGGAGDPAGATAEAIRGGAGVVYQGTLAGEGDGAALFGRPDFLVRADLLPAPDGEPRPAGIHYEVVDAKLARSAKARAVLQTVFYSQLLADVQPIAPRWMHLALGNGEFASFKVNDFAAYERQTRRLLEAAIGADPAAEVYPEPVEHCAICRWRDMCRERRRTDDDLSLVAGITTGQRRALKGAGISTRRGFAGRPGLPRLDRVSPDVLERARRQARLQVASEDDGVVRFELLDPERDADGALVANRGLLALPEPADGDLFFDIEGARYYSEDGREFGLQYLFGVVDTAEVDEAGLARYTQIWAFDRPGEKRAFEELIDFITERRARHPGLHVYHYNHYEPTSVDHLTELHGTRQEAVGALMGRFATREDEVDDLFRLGVFTDLYRVVRQGVRAGVESYSIKRLEPLCGYSRRVDLAEATASLIALEAALEEGTAGDAAGDLERRRVVAGYNEDDCRATLALRDWLEERRAELAGLAGLAGRLGEELPRPVFAQKPGTPEDPELARISSALLAGVSAETPEGRARALLADLLDWHRREDKPAWWRYFYLRTLSPAELTGEPDALGGLRGGEVVGQVKKSVVRRFRFPAQEHKFSAGGTACDPGTDKQWSICDVDDARGTIDLKAAGTYAGPWPAALIEAGPPRTREQRDRLRDLGDRVVRAGFGGGDMATALLLRRRPDDGDDAVGSLRAEGETAGAAAIRLATSLRHSYLPMQGPPGTGKTYTAAEQILELVTQGRMVGITGPSHAVICHLIDTVYEHARWRGAGPPRIGQRADRDHPHRHADARTMSNEQLEKALRDGELDVAAGTTWLWARSGLAGSVDTLFVDEAGQLSLASVLAVAGAARNLILLGDPQQLAQPSHATHPPGAGASALEHILDGRATMPAAAGLLLDQTWRMHPDLCRYTSAAFYDGKLGGVDGLGRQEIQGWGSGLRLVEVPHQGNTNASPEEAREVARLAGQLTGQRWRDKNGAERSMEPADILIVTPYNAQIRAIQGALAGIGQTGFRVGTVDKFQGQEAPAVIYSMATSSADEAPRGLDFLYDPHRLNVATSRARALAIIVASPDLIRVSCRTPHQMVLANALCRAWETGG
jgi:uncharacterized protein